VAAPKRTAKKTLVAPVLGIRSPAAAVKTPAADPHDHLRGADEEKLARVIERAGLCPLTDRAKDPPNAEQSFRSLVHAIVSQQLSGKAADTIFGRVEALGGGTLPSATELLALPDEKLRAVGLSGAKTRGVKDLAARVLDGSLKLDALHAHDDEAVIEALVRVRGIGRWTAEMFLMFRLGRLDVLSTGDLGVRKGMMRLFGLPDLPDPATMEKLSVPWRPFRSVACWYLWRVAEEAVPAAKLKPATKTVAKAGVKKPAPKPSRAEQVLSKR
jgi:DNA-3-methyladenine glycosylase II